MYHTIILSYIIILDTSYNNNNYRYYTRYNTGIILGTSGSWVACNAPSIPTPLSFLNLIILISILVTSVLQSWYSASLLVVSTNEIQY
jgi:hypothetical protein